MGPFTSSRPLVLQRIGAPLLLALAIGLSGCERMVEAFMTLVLLTVLVFADVLALVGLGVAFFGSRPPHLVHLVLSYLLLGVYGFAAVMFDQTSAISREEMLHMLAVGLPLSLPILLWPIWATAIRFHRQSVHERPPAPIVAGAVASVALLIGLALFARAYGETRRPLHPITVIPRVGEYRELLAATSAEATRPVATAAPKGETSPRVERGPVPSRAPYSLLASVGEALTPAEVPSLPGEAGALRVVEARAYDTKRLRILSWELADRAAASDARERMLRWAELANVFFPKIAQNERVLVVVGFADDKPVTPTQEDGRMRFVRAFSADTR